MKRTYDAGTRRLTWQFGGSVPPIAFEVPNVIIDHPSRDCSEAALVNGFSQKIGDAAAIARNTETGKSATDSDKRAAMLQVIQNLEAGIWNAVRAAAPKTVDVTALVAVIAAKLDKNPTRIRAYVEAKDEAGRRALADSAEFAESYVLQVAKSRPLVALSAEIDAELDAIE